jgi:hypothetical protein
MGIINLNIKYKPGYDYTREISEKLVIEVNKKLEKDKPKKRNFFKDLILNTKILILKSCKTGKVYLKN